MAIHQHICGTLAIDDATVMLFGEIPFFERRAYHALLSLNVAMEFNEFSILSEKSDAILLKFIKNTGFSCEVQENLRLLKNSISRQEAKINGFVKLFSNLLCTEDSLALMNLTMLRKKPSLNMFVTYFLLFLLIVFPLS